MTTNSNKNKLFFSKPGLGWFEFDVPEELKSSTMEKLGNWAVSTARKHQFKGILITENPCPYPVKKRI
jgi:hypothetical protein